MTQETHNAAIDTSAPAAVDAAQGAAESVAGLDSLLDNAYTWIGLSFAIVVFLFVRYLMPAINKGLDARAQKIRDQLEQANRLRTEAQELLAQYKAEQEAMLKQAEEIVSTATRDAANIRARAAEELKTALERRSTQAQEKVARAEAEAIAGIRARIVETATESARTMLAEQAVGAADEQAIARAISSIETQIH